MPGEEIPHGGGAALMATLHLIRNLLVIVGFAVMWKGWKLIHGTSDSGIFQVIGEGVKGAVMEGLKRNRTEEMRWHLVNYIKSPEKARGKGQ